MTHRVGFLVLVSAPPRGWIATYHEAPIDLPHQSDLYRIRFRNTARIVDIFSHRVLGVTKLSLLVEAFCIFLVFDRLQLFCGHCDEVVSLGNPR